MFFAFSVSCINWHTRNGEIDAIHARGPRGYRRS